MMGRGALFSTVVSDLVTLSADAENDIRMKLRLETHEEEGRLGGFSLENIKN